MSAQKPYLERFLEQYGQEPIKETPPMRQGYAGEIERYLLRLTNAVSVGEEMYTFEFVQNDDLRITNQDTGAYYICRIDEEKRQLKINSPRGGINLPANAGEQAEKKMFEKAMEKLMIAVKATTAGNRTAA